MKGIVFLEFATMVESVFGEDMLDDIICDCEKHLSTQGAYTSVGTYSHEEIVALVGSLSKRTGIEASALVHSFGRHLAKVFADKFPNFFAECDSCFEFYKRIDDHIHVEVQKLYPDAELPAFSFEQPDANTFILVYRSARSFADLAIGLLEGVAEHYQEKITITVKDKSDGQGSHVIFTMKK